MSWRLHNYRPSTKAAWFVFCSVGISTLLLTLSYVTVQLTNIISPKKDAQNMTLPTISCSTKGRARFDCYDHYYTELSTTEGIAASFQDLKLRTKKDIHAKKFCHQITHSIGHAAAKMHPGILDAFAYGDDYCWSGYYHGLIEDSVKLWGKEYIFTHINDICSRVPGKERYSFAYHNCVHGIGHGLLGMHAGDMFEALESCKKLLEQRERASCYGGVFMENIMIEARGGTTTYLDPINPLYPCPIIAEKYQSECYLAQPSYALKQLGGDFKKIFELCASIPHTHRSTCFRSIGKDAASTSLNEVQQTKAICILGTSLQQQGECLVGAALDFVGYYHDSVKALDLCGQFEGVLKNTCTTVVRDYEKAL